MARVRSWGVMEWGSASAILALVVTVIALALNQGASKTSVTIRTEPARPLRKQPIQQDVPRSAVPTTGPALVDGTLGLRVYSGPDARSQGTFARAIRVQHGDVVQVGCVVQNAEGDLTRIAKNLRITFSIPLARARAVTLEAAINADNVRRSPRYELSPTAALTASGSRPFRIAGARNLQVQLNQTRSDRRLSWGRLIDVPPGPRALPAVTSNDYSLTVRPTLDGTLGPSRTEMFRLLFLFDIT